VEVLITAAAEFPGVIFTMLIIDKLGRTKTLALEFAGSTVCGIVLMFCPGRLAETILLSAIRACITGTFIAISVYTPEAHPTNVRATAMGVCTSFSRIGGVFTLFVAALLTSITYIWIACYFWCNSLRSLRLTPLTVTCATGMIKQGFIL